MPIEELMTRIRPFLPQDFPQEKLPSILPLISERLTKLSEVEELTDFFYRNFEIAAEAVVGKQETQSALHQLEETIKVLENTEEWSVANLESTIRSLQESHDWKKRDYFMFLRTCSTGKTATPPLFETMEVIGKETILTRLRQALSHVS
jgi:glutamyl-tRNA synthetase